MGKQTLWKNRILNSFYKTNTILIPKLDEGIQVPTTFSVCLLLAFYQENTTLLHIAIFKMYNQQRPTL